MEKKNVNKKSDELARLLEGLKQAGLEHGSRNKSVAKKSGYSEHTVLKVLSGNATLTPRFVQAVCSAFGVSKTWVETGTPVFPTRRDPRAGDDSPIEKTAPLDAPTQEIVNDMKRLTESNRWVFVGKVKPILQAMIEEQGENKASG